MDDGYMWRGLMSLDPEVEVFLKDGKKLKVKNELAAAINALKNDVQGLKANAGGVVDPNALAAALAGSETFVNALAQAILTENAKRVQNG